MGQNGIGVLRAKEDNLDVLGNEQLKVQGGYSNRSIFCLSQSAPHLFRISYGSVLNPNLLHILSMVLALFTSKLHRVRLSCIHPYFWVYLIFLVQDKNPVCSACNAHAYKIIMVWLFKLNTFECKPLWSQKLCELFQCEIFRAEIFESLVGIEEFVAASPASKSAHSIIPP